MRHTASTSQFAEMPSDRVRSSRRDRLQLQHQGQIKTRHVSSMHPVDGGVEYVVRTDLVDGCCMDAVVKVGHLRPPDTRCPALAGAGGRSSAMRLSTQDQQLSWTALGVRMGCATEAPQREDILAAVGRIVWQSATAQLMFDSPAVQAVVAAIMGRGWRLRIRRVGITQINGGRQLVGVDDAHGTRQHVIDLASLSEALHVLTHTAACPTAA
jgi:hypothetical protein